MYKLATTRLHLVAFLYVMVCFNARAEDYSWDFNSGLPDDAEIYGVAQVVDFGGVQNSGVVSLTQTVTHQEGGITLSPLEGEAISGFTARFSVWVYGGKGGAGFSFSFAPDLTNGVMTELGAASGLAVSFDTYRNKDDKFAPAIRILRDKTIIAEAPVAVRMEKFINVLVQLTSDGKVNLDYNDETVFTNVVVGTMYMTGRFAFGARTGGWFDNHWIDNFTLTTENRAPDFLASVSPLGQNVAPDAAIEISLADWKKVKPEFVRMRFDDNDVIPEDTFNGKKDRVLRYTPGELLQPGSSHAVHISYEEPGETNSTNSFVYRFTVSPHIMLSK